MPAVIKGRNPGAALRRAVPSPGALSDSLARYQSALVAGSARTAGALRTRTGGFGALTFALFVVVPTLVFGLYLALLASNQYVAEVRFAVRGSVQSLPGGDQYNGLTGNAVRINNNQESQFIAVYIRSRAMLAAVRRRLDLDAIFNRPRLDLWARLGSAPTVEDDERYWQHMVHATVEAISGIVTVEVRAFSPDDAVAIANVIQDESEQLLNTLTERIRRETLAATERHLRTEAEHLAQVRSELLEFRGRQGFIDAGSAAKSAVDTLASIQQERIQRATELDAARRGLSADAPSLKQLTDRVAVLDTMLERLRTQSASDPKSLLGSGSSGEQRSRFDWLTAQRQMAEQQVKTAETALDRARLELERRQLFVTTFSPAAAPERSSYPRRMSSLILTFLGCAMVWSLISMFVALIREHTD